MLPLHTASISNVQGHFIIWDV